MNNDLISREALKKALKSNCDLCHDKNTNWCEHCCPLNDFEDLIDNAPTVEAKTTHDVSSAYDKGFITAMKAYGRAQGEWIKVKEERMSVDMSGEIVTRYKCSKCGRVIATFPNKLAEYYPFCHCGAKMKGGVDNG